MFLVPHFYRFRSSAPWSPHRHFPGNAHVARAHARFRPLNPRRPMGRHHPDGKKCKFL